MPLSLVAFYGEKPPALFRLITQLQRQLRQQLGKAFQPYTVEQVHATLIGMELLDRQGSWYSRWCLENRAQISPADLAGFRTHLREHFPGLEIQIGGFQAGLDYGFTSRSEHPYYRTFQIQGGRAILMGWPVEKPSGIPEYPESICHFRTHAERFGFCHKWHRAGYRDNDCYLVLGTIDPETVPVGILAQTERILRTGLALRQERCALTRDNLSIVAYRNPDLPPDSTHSISVTDPEISIEYLLSLA